MLEKEIVLTPHGLRKIEQELEHLKTVHRKEVTERIRESKQFGGELTENAEYEDAKAEQAFIEGRIMELKKILMHAMVLNEKDIQTDHVGIGSTVTVKDLATGDQWDYQIVGSYEADPLEDRISNESPVGQALMGHKVGDKVEVNVPDGVAVYKIIKIRKSDTGA